MNDTLGFNLLSGYGCRKETAPVVGATEGGRAVRDAKVLCLFCGKPLKTNNGKPVALLWCATEGCDFHESFGELIFETPTEHYRVRRGKKVLEEPIDRFMRESRPINAPDPAPTRTPIRGHYKKPKPKRCPHTMEMFE